MRDMPDKGKEVIVLKSANDETVYMFGKGEYKGEVKPSEQEELTEKYPGFATIDFPSPAIEMEDGDLIFGFECWWGEVEDFDDWADGREVEEVSIHEYRKESGLTEPRAT